MLHILILVFAMFAGRIDANPASSRNDNIGRIISGVNVTDPKENPWMVAVTSTLLATSQQFICGGVLVSPTYVLTAKHCANDSFSNIQVNAGSVNRTGTLLATGGIRYAPAKATTYYGDIALVLLAKPFTKSETIATIPIYYNAIGENVIVTATGWGRTESGMSSTILMKVDLKTITNKQCLNYYSADIVQSDVLCTMVDNRKSTCPGDSGGPLTTLIAGKRYLVGITSFGTESCAGAPNGFIRMSEWSTFLTRYLGQQN